LQAETGFHLNGGTVPGIYANLDEVFVLEILPDLFIIRGLRDTV